MKRFVCKERLKTGIGLIFIELLFWLAISYTIIIINKFHINSIFISILIGVIGFITTLSITLFELKQYFGRIMIEESKITLFSFKSSYTIEKNKICIMYVSPEITPRFSGKMIYSIKIRVKGEKDTIPIKIMDEDIIKELLLLLDIRRDPQDIKFEWEN